MACPLILYFFLILTVMPVCNPLTSYHVDVNIFVKNNDTEMRSIVQEATGLFHRDNGKYFTEKRRRQNSSKSQNGII